MTTLLAIVVYATVAATAICGGTVLLVTGLVIANHIAWRRRRRRESLAPCPICEITRTNEGHLSG